MAKKVALISDSISLLKSGKYQGIFSTGVKMPGTNRYYREYFYGDDERALMLEMNAYISKFDKESYAQSKLDSAAASPKPSDDDISLSEAVERYLFDSAYGKTRPKTFENYVAVWRNYIAKRPIGKKYLRDVKTTDIEKALTGLNAEGFSMSTIDKVLVVLGKFYKYCKKSKCYDCVTDNIVDDDDINATMRLMAKAHEAAAARNGDDKVKAISLEQLKVFLIEAKAKTRLWRMFVVMATTGLRPGEALALRWQDLDLQNLRLRVTGDICRVTTFDPETRTSTGTVLTEDDTKTTSSLRTVYLHPDHVRLFEAQRAQLAAEKASLTTNNKGKKKYHDNDYIFPNLVGKKQEQRKVNTICDEIVDSKGDELEGFTPHCLRHTYATLCERNDVRYVAVQKLMGHSSSRDVTARYTKAHQDEVEATFHEHMDDVIAEILSWC